MLIITTYRWRIMFCPHCGVKIENPNQRFCKNCGEGLQPISGALTEKTISHPITLDPNIQFIKQKRIEKRGPYSKKTLGFGIASIIIAENALAFGISFIPFSLPNFFPRFAVSMFIILSIFHIVGLIFGIASKINNQHARELESLNTFTKVGNVLGIIGIVSNTILMVISFVIIGLFW